MRITMCNLVLVSKYENGHMIISILSRQVRARKIILDLVSKNSREWEWEWDSKSNPITELHSRQLETKWSRGGGYRAEVKFADMPACFDFYNNEISRMPIKTGPLSLTSILYLVTALVLEIFRWYFYLEYVRRQNKIKQAKLNTILDRS